MTDRTSDASRDPHRLAALRRLELLDTPAQAAFDRLTRLATTILDAPVALASLVDEDRQFFASCVGLPEPWASARETPLSHSFCQHTMVAGAPLVIPDARAHPLVRDNLAIPDLGVVAYLGIPLVTPDGQPLGAFCVIDHRPREWTAREIALLTDLAASVLTEIELRATAREAAALAEERDRLLAREQATRAAAEADRARLRQVVDALPEAVTICDAAGRFILSNRAVVDLLGVDPVGQLMPLDDPGSYEGYGARRLDGSPYPSRELPMQRSFLEGVAVLGERAIFRNAATGRDVPCLINSVPLRDAAGAPAGALAVFQDITALQELDRDREAFLSAVAHDLKTPLTNIQGQAQLAQRQLDRLALPEGARLAERLRGILTATARATALVDEQMDVMRAQSGESLALDRRPADLVALARRVVAEQGQTAPRHRLRLEAAPADLVGDVDADRLARVITNLLSNAVKYSPDGGDVTVRLAREEGAGGPWAVLTVADRGLGIPAADLPRIGERFHRGGNVAGRIDGTGLGLAGARQIVAAHGGTLDLASTEGVGTTATVRLPLAMSAVAGVNGWRTRRQDA